MVDAHKCWFSGALQVPVESSSASGFSIKLNLHSRADYFILNRWSIFLEPSLDVASSETLVRLRLS